MSKNIKNGTFIHGIAASEHIDSSGERILIKGVDITSLTKDGVFNFEHQSKEAGHIVGKILEAKKILKKEDCENEAHKYFWNKVKMPFVYVAGELFDQVGHGSAQDVAAMLRYDKGLNKDETKALVNFSIEGSRLGREGSNITKCIARKVSITITPCNKMAHAEHMEAPSKDTKKSGGIDISKEILSKFKKSEGTEIEMIKAEGKYYTNLYNKKTSKFNQEKNPKSKANYKPQTPSSMEPKKPASPLPKPKREFSQTSAPDKLRVGDRIKHKNKGKARTGHDIYNDPKTWEKSEKKTTEKMKIDLKKKKKKKNFYTSNVRKAITASIGVGAPSTRTGGAALQKESLCKKKVYKNLSEEAWKNYPNKTELVEFISEKEPNMTKSEVLAVAKTYSYLEQLKTEKKLEDL